MTNDNLFKINAGIVRTLCYGIVACCPKASSNFISNLVTTLPIAAEVYKKTGTFDPRQLLGVTKLEVVGANKIVVDVPVIGGHAGVTTLPIVSKNGGTEVEAKAGVGSATLSMRRQRKSWPQALRTAFPL